MSSIAQIIRPVKEHFKRALKWIVIANAGLAVIGILFGGSTDVVLRVHGTSLLVAVSAVSLAVIEQGRFRAKFKSVWLAGSVCSAALGLTLIALTWGIDPPDSFGRPVGSIAVISVATTYCAVISAIAQRVRLRRVCWGGAYGHSLYVLAIIWFQFDFMPGRILALLAVGQTACSLIAVIDFIGSRRSTIAGSELSELKAQYCPYCGAEDLTRLIDVIECRDCGGRFQTLNKSMS